MIKISTLDVLLRTGLTAAVNAAGNILLRKGLVAAGGFRPTSILSAFLLFISFMKNIDFVAGLSLYLMATLIWMSVISSSSLQIAYPTLVGLSFVAVLIGNSLVFNDATLRTTVIGGLMIVSGVAVVLLGKQPAD